MHLVIRALISANNFLLPGKSGKLVIWYHFKTFSVSKSTWTTSLRDLFASSSVSNSLSLKNLRRQRLPAPPRRLWIDTKYKELTHVLELSAKCWVFAREGVCCLSVRSALIALSENISALSVGRQLAGSLSRRHWALYCRVSVSSKEHRGQTLCSSSLLEFFSWLDAYFFY